MADEKDEEVQEDGGDEEDVVVVRISKDAAGFLFKKDL